MPLQSATITFDASDYGNDTTAKFDPRRDKVWVTNNALDGVIHDTAANKQYVRTGNPVVNEDGAGEVTVPVPGAGSIPETWQTTIHFDITDRNSPTGRHKVSFGPFTITGDGTLGSLIEEMPMLPVYAEDVLERLAALEAGGGGGGGGEPGPTGATGATGAKGDKGDPGADGTDGVDGAAGAKGDKGDKGNTGSQGIQGIPGVKGDRGDVGPAGAASTVPGPAGAPGTPGAKGDKGDTGDRGAPGAKGDPGDDGADGADGVGVPAGGAAAQVLAKASGADFDTAWVDPASGGGGGGPVHGNGFPTGTPAIGTEYVDDDEINGALKWIYTSSGWRVIVGDTDWRNIATLATASGVLGGGAQTFRIRRIGPFVTLVFDQFTTTNSTFTGLFDWPTGFAPAVGVRDSARNANYTLATGGFNFHPAALYLDGGIPTGTPLWLARTYLTDAVWPTTLPGTPA